MISFHSLQSYFPTKGNLDLAELGSKECGLPLLRETMRFFSCFSLCLYASKASVGTAWRLKCIQNADRQ